MLFRKLPLVLVVLSFFAFACNDDGGGKLDVFCEVDGSIECADNVNGRAVHRVCVDGTWKNTICGEFEDCREGGCVAKDNVCSETATRCADAKTVELCVVSKAPSREICGDGLVCDAAACAKGDDCCVLAKSCAKTENRCLDLHSVELCVEGAKAEIEICGDGFHCASGACVAGKTCTKTVNTCADLRTAEICVKDAVVAFETCDEGFYCDSGACVAGKICDKTENTCLDNGLVERCVVDRLPIEEACGAKLGCSDGACVDACHNNRLDVGEDAVDCGGDCTACVTCRVDADCGVDGFCDSASGYVCSKRCRSDKDCANNHLWDGDHCRDDGRCSPKVFETVWEVTADDLTVVLPFRSVYGAKCDFQVLWGDEPTGTDIATLPRITSCSYLKTRTHTYSKAGRYHVKIIGSYDGWGDFDQINIDEDVLTTASSKLRSVLSFGPVGLQRGAFYGAQKLIEMPKKDIPDASKMNNLSSCFAQALEFNAPIGHWDTSSVTDMERVFYGASAFDQPIGKWDTSQVKSMYLMFSEAKVFNQPIGDWDTSKVTKMGWMFYEASAFNQPIGKWNTSQVTNISMMFNAASQFNQPLGSWNTSNVEDMGWIFGYASAFNQDISTWILKDGVRQSSMFTESGMKPDNLCKLKAVGGEWLTLSEVSGAVCPGD